MNNDNEDLNEVLIGLIQLRNTEKDPKRRGYLTHLIGKQIKGIEISERDIEWAFNGAIRGAEFPGDMVGRPNDDFDDDYTYFEDDYHYKRGDDKKDDQTKKDDKKD